MLVTFLVKNISSSTILISELGLTIDAGTYGSVGWNDMDEAAGSNDLLGFVNNNQAIINNLGSDLNKSDSIAFLGGILLTNTLYAPTVHTHANGASIGGPYYTQAQLQTSGQATVNWGNITNAPSSFTPPVATSGTLGGIKQGANVAIDANGVISVAAPYSLPVATSTVLGGVKQGANVAIDANGVVSVAAPYAHPTGDGNLHVPATGTTNNTKVLKSGSMAGSGAWGQVQWSELGSVPASFPPSTHTHLNDSSIGGPFYTQVQLQTSGQASVNWANVTNKPTLGGSNWLASAKSKYTGNVAPSGATPAGSNGDRIIWYSGTGSNQHVYQMASGAWADAYTPTLGDMVLVDDDGDGKGAQYFYNGTVWTKISDVDWGNHASLSGLANDDHPQYHNGTLAFTAALNMGGFSVTNVGTVDGVDVSAHTHSGANQGGAVDHSSLASIGTKTHAQIDAHIADATVHFTAATVSHSVLQSLGNDDHTQYVLASGTRAFTAVVSGVTPTASAHLATKGYVDGQVSTGYAFKTFTGITNNVVATAIADTVTLGSANSALTIVGTTATKTITFAIVPGNISHSALGNLGGDHHTQYLNAARHSAISGNPHSTTLTQAIIADAAISPITVANLKALVNGSDAGALHIHDGRYFTQAQANASLGVITYGAVSANSGVFVTAAQLVTLTNGSNADGLHTHAPSNSENGMDDDYNSGRAINVDAGEVELRASGGFAPLRLTQLSSAPTLNLAAGMLCVYDNTLFLYDAARSHWLSVDSVPFAAAYSGTNAKNTYLLIHGNSCSASVGYVMPWDGTVCAMGGVSASATNNSLEVRINGSTLASLPWSNGKDAHSDSVNADFNEGDILSLYISGASNGCTNPVCWIGARRRI